MGCGQSKNQIGVSSGLKDTAPGAANQSPVKRTSSKKINVKSTDNIDNRHTSDLEDEVEIPPPENSRKKNKRLVKKNSWVMGSQDSLGGSDGNTDSRGGSATSKGSHHSADSGFADNEYQKVITEFSNADAVQEIENGFETPRDLGKYLIVLLLYQNNILFGSCCFDLACNHLCCHVSIKILIYH